ncbi:MAG: DUF2202 domain-containing protein [Anaerolineales bacterium]|nr:DUF2202 domain-containing protein [Anaerolineales bacterium]
MLKKILLGTILIAITGALIAGGVIRTLDKTQQAEASYGTGLGSQNNTNSGRQGQGRNNDIDGDHLYTADPEAIQSQAGSGYRGGSGQAGVKADQSESGSGYRGGNAQTDNESIQSQAGNGYRGGSEQAGGSFGHGDSNLPAASDLSSAEEADLIFNWEEEKMARDVYTALYELWEHPSFQNIASSEQSHMDAIMELIERYDLQDAVADLGAGKYSDPELQALYTALTVAGSESLLSALQVGATIEDLDIYNLQNSIVLTDNADMEHVYQNLMNGSYNHLRSFVSGIEMQGGTYQAQYLSQAEVDAILASSAGAGQGGGRQGAGNGQGGNGQKNH